MVFSSILFLFYFLPAFLVLYYCAPHSWRNSILLLASILFYSWNGPVFLFVILCTTGLDYFLVRQIEKSENKQSKKRFLLVSLCLNLGLLFSFKYLYFFSVNIDHVLGLMNVAPIAMKKIALPIGISFFTFESLTYVIDVYRGDYRSLRSFRDYLTYILMFPKLIAGPIVPYNKIAAQIEQPRLISSEMRLAGMMRFILGLSKKVLIANILGETVKELYALPEDQLSTAMAWAMSVGYTMQLYFDFSGYCDMAIGICSMMGFHIPENFNFPYISKSITEFWRRWHISLGNWMRNYLYIPLGGNQGSVFRTYFNLWIVFLISGFWHGAGWNYLIWGAYNGFFLVLERLLLKKYLQNIGGIFYTFLVANFGWVLFRNEDLGEAWRVYRKMFSISGTNHAFADLRFLIVIAVALFFSFAGTFPRLYRLAQEDEQLYCGRSLRLSVLYIATIILFLLSASYLTGQDFNPFIYFRF